MLYMVDSYTYISRIRVLCLVAYGGIKKSALKNSNRGILTISLSETHPHCLLEVKGDWQLEVSYLPANF